jgi:DNA-directed RNA polymerase subunit RPC12/RpoP
MRVVCENCGATYKIPESKLVKEVNKATCRKCGFRMMIRRPSAAVVSDASAGNPNEEPDAAVTQITANPLERQDSEPGLLEAETRIAPGAVNEWNEDSPTNVQVDPTVPPAAGSGAAPKATPPKATPPMARPSAPSGRADSDMILALVATFASAGGAMLLATNTADEST